MNDIRGAPAPRLSLHTAIAGDRLPEGPGQCHDEPSRGRDAPLIGPLTARPYLEGDRAGQPYLIARVILFRLQAGGGHDVHDAVDFEFFADAHYVVA